MRGGYNLNRLGEEDMSGKSEMIAEREGHAARREFPAACA
jgi:hypothetical protein